MKFSIIVPVYNVSAYLKKCVDSILDQSYSNFELILVNDGSRDNSGSICDSFSDSRVVVIHKENGGAADARNFGLKRATGDYVMFIDGDDFLYTNDCLSKINDVLLKNQYDIVQYKMVNYYENNDQYQLNKDIVECNSNYIESLNELNMNGNLSISPCDKVVKLSIIKDNSIYYEVGRVAEDIDWNLNLYQYTKNIYILNEDIYVYRRQRKGSVSTSRNSKKSKDLLFVINKWFDIEYKNLDLKKIYYNFLSYEFLILMTVSSNNDFNKEEKAIIKKLQVNLINYDENYKVKMFKKVKKIFGFKLSYLIMKVYMGLKNKGLIKL